MAGLSRQTEQLPVRHPVRARRRASPVLRRLKNLGLAAITLSTGKTWVC
ncbi:pollen-specific leucine-rich repeat extensin-like protein 4 [Iris pallida]|uniref:Pollen-specific leucine-rich repeat extensin-like protein 4 n=1 Tax=Iris pallida TaxID=29817 RepID=A0AAX6HHN4_IRIPA|nr:pollen-specific leucine-rich repeat extensin-like protein 4 [Iris pallida]